MSNRAALFIAVLILAALAIDQFWNDGIGTLVVLRRAYVLLEWLIFWR